MALIRPHPRRSVAAAPPAGASATYWRVNCMRCASDIMAIAELEFRSSVGGANLATGGTAISGNGNDGIPGNAYDGNGATAWSQNPLLGVNADADNGGAGPWLGYAFTSAVTIEEISITAMTGGAQNRAPRVIALDYSTDSGSTWVRYKRFAEQAAWGAGETRVFSDATLQALPSTPWTDAHRYWRLLFTAGVSGSSIAFNEFELRATAGGANMCIGKTATAENTGFGLPAPNAIDGNTSTIYHSAGGVWTGWLAVDLGSASVVREYAILPRPGFAGQFPRLQVLQYSDDGTNYNDAMIRVQTTGPTSLVVYTSDIA